MWKLNVFLFALSLSSYYGDCAITTESDWDLLLFVQHWPETVCKIYLEKNASNTCKYPDKDNAWSVHGIWPTKFHSMGPTWCDETWKFQPEDIRSIEGELEQGWIDIHGESPAYEFWGTEWEKHGTCSVSVGDLNTEFKYFKQGLKWFDIYPMEKILSDAKILPSDTKLYRVEDFHEAIVNNLRVKPVIECYKSINIDYIVELRICFDKKLVLKDCTGSLSDSAIITNCNFNRGIIFPQIPKRHTI